MSAVAGDGAAGRSRLEVARAACVKMKRRILDEREIARPAFVCRPFGDGFPAPPFDVGVRAQELVDAEVLADASTQLCRHHLDRLEQVAVSPPVASLRLELAERTLPITADDFGEHGRAG